MTERARHRLRRAEARALALEAELIQRGASPAARVDAYLAAAVEELDAYSRLLLDEAGFDVEQAFAGDPTDLVLLTLQAASLNRDREALSRLVRMAEAIEVHRATLVDEAGEG